MIQLLSDIVDAVFLLILLWSALRTVRALMGGGRAKVGRREKRQAPAREPAGGGSTARDPVCGMFVSTEVSHRLADGGKIVHFCSDQCLREYQKGAVKAS